MDCGTISVISLAGLDALWSLTLGDPHICIAVLDGPVDLTHPCFAGARLTLLETLVPGSAGNDPATEHGTHVASVIFGQHGSPVQGIAPKCRGLIVPIYSAAEGDFLACSQLDLARAINQAVANGAHVINISGGELAQSGAADPILAEAIKSCSRSGVLIVAAAGNNGCRCLHVPASVPSVLAVGAMDAQGSPLEFSNWGGVYRVQGVLAPGENIPGAALGAAIVRKTGTSFAAPIISGIAGLLLSRQLALGAKPDGQRVQTAILDTADPCDPKDFPDCSRFLAGRLNLPAACSKMEGQLQIFPASAAEDAGIKRFGCNNQSLQTTHGIEEIMTEQTNTTDSHPRINAGPGAEDGAARRVMAAQHVVQSGDAGSTARSERAAESLPPRANLPATLRPSELEPSECACTGAKGAAGGGASALVYALGQIGYDFGTEARRDSFVQQAEGKNVQLAADMLDYLKQEPASAASFIWTLTLDTTVIYAIQPFGAFASLGYDRLKEFLKEQAAEGVERVSIPGYLRGSAQLLNGQQVPVIHPEVRGMCSWSTTALMEAVVGKEPKEQKDRAEHNAKSEGIQNFLDRIYYEVRNLGLTSQERAMNYAATDALRLEYVYKDSYKSGMKLDSIGLEKSPICRPGADCWDVKLVFFNPAKRLEQARHVYRFTVDVSDVIPVNVGKPREWDIY